MKNFFIKSIFVITCLLAGLSAIAADFDVDGLYYNYVSEDNATCALTYKTWWRHYSGDIVVPAKVTYDDKTYTVVEIGSEAFDGCSEVTSVSIPYSVTKINSDSFTGCTTLASMTLEDGSDTLEVGDNAFSACPFTSFYLGRILKTNTLPLTNQSSLASFTIGGQVNYIPYDYFNSCTGLKTLSIKASSTKLVMDYCDDWKSIFTHCPLETVYLRRNMGYNVSPFDGQSKLTNLVISDATDLPHDLFSNCTGITTLRIPATVNTIGFMTFSGCSGLKTLIFEKGNNALSLQDASFGNAPDSIFLGRNINQSDALQGNEGLISVGIGSNVDSIPMQTFAGCAKFKRFVVEDGNEKYSTIDGVLTNKDKTTLVMYPFGGDTIYTVPKSIVNIGHSAFEYCYHLNTVTIPNTVKNIGEKAFYDCFYLKHISLPESITEISNDMFGQCRELTTVAIPSSVVTIGENAFSMCSKLTLLTYPMTLKKIGYGAFSYDGNLSSFIIPDSITEIENSTFRGCSAITSITIPKLVKTIGENAFTECKSLKSFIIPNTVDTIGGSIISNCTNLKSLIIEDGDVALKANGNSFADNYADSIYIGRQLKSESSPFINQSNTTKLMINNNMTEITAGYFKGCSSLTSLLIPHSVTSIGEEAFASCSKLASLTIPNTVTTIGDYAFSNSSSLKVVVIEPGASTLSIGKGSQYGMFDYSPLDSVFLGRNLSYDVSPFQGVTKLTSVTIGDSVTQIGHKAFYGCSNLKNLVVSNSVGMIGSNALIGTKWLDDQPDGLVYAGLVAYKYKGTMPYNTSIEIANGTKGIAVGAFSGCSDLASVSIPNTVTNIGSIAFNGCSLLSEISIPNSVRLINIKSFVNCSGLKSVKLGDNLKSMGVGAFLGCTGIETVTSSNMDAPKLDTLAFESSVTNNAKLFIREGSNVLASYLAANIWKDFAYIYQSLPTNVESVGSTLKVATEGDEIIIAGAADNAQVQVYNIEGRVIYSGIEKVITVPENGVYIVKVAGITKKVIL
jgi:hypothetical protein